MERLLNVPPYGLCYSAQPSRVALGRNTPSPFRHPLTRIWGWSTSFLGILPIFLFQNIKRSRRSSSHAGRNWITFVRAPTAPDSDPRHWSSFRGGTETSPQPSLCLN